MHVTLHHRTEIAPNIISFSFETEKPLRQTAGQFIELHLPHKDKDKRGDKRWFTLSSAPEDPYPTITTNITTDNGSSFKKRLLELQVGETVVMAAPMGDFVLPKDTSTPLLFIAGGIGCTPFHSIISSLQQRDETRDISFIYSARSPERLAFRETFEALGKHFYPIVQDTTDSWDGLTGTLAAEIIQGLDILTPEHRVFLSGPEPMVAALNKDLKKSGVNRRHILTDFFPGYSTI